jgi:guanylate kinase
VTTLQTSSPLVARQGVLLVLSSPSGAGKTTLAKAVLNDDPNIALSISVTTRAKRPGETHGKDYFFIDQPEFIRQRDAGQLLEWAEVHGNFYATPRGPVDAAVAAGRDVLFDIDWQGAQQLNERASVPVTRVFVLPPSAAILRQRLVSRAQDPADIVERRLQGAAAEIAHWGEYDYVIVNENLEVSIATLRGILAAERVRRQRQIGLSAFVAKLIR